MGKALIMTLQMMSSLHKERKLNLLNAPKETSDCFNEIIAVGNTLPVPRTIEKIERMEEVILQHPQVELPVNHYFGQDVYVRELFFKKGTIATGRVHKFDHISILISGHMTIWTPEKGVHDVFGPSITEVNSGMKRAGFAHTDVHWCCAYGVKDLDDYAADELLDFLTFRYYGDFLKFNNIIEHKGN